MKRACLLIAVFIIFAGVARADEFHLKDGSTIIGTIVSYDKDSFRVKTSYGYALVLRSAVASITISNSASPAEKKIAATKKPGGKEENREESASQKSDESTKQPREVNVAESKSSTEPKTDFAPARTSDEKQSAAAGQAAPAKSPENSSAAATQTNAASQPSAPASPQVPPEPPAPAPMREQVQGNYYLNDTYGFAIFKPPDWDVIPGARAALPGAIVAMGTPDQTTYLIIGLEPAGGTLANHVAATNERMSNMFDDFRPLAVHQTAIAGIPASEYQFNGSADGKEWTGTVALLEQDGNVYTILGVTSANTDLVQIQQNVITRTIASLQFGKP